MRKIALAFGLLAVLQLPTAHAYIGPATGAGTIAIVLGILSSIFLAFVGILWYPIKRLTQEMESVRKAFSRAQAGGGRLKLRQWSRKHG